MSILNSSPSNNRFFDAEIAEALGDINAAVIVQQLHYWMQKKGVGVMVDGVKWIYNTFYDWINEQFKWLSIWQFRKSMALLRSLSIVKVVRYRAREWNQTNYYSLDYDRLLEYLRWKNPESIEISEMCATTDRSEDVSQVEARDSKSSLIDPKITSEDKTAEHSVVAFENKAKDEENNSKQSEVSKSKCNPSAAQNQPNENQNQKATGEKSKASECSIKEAKEVETVNSEWKSQVKQLDELGIQTNSTVVKLVKQYEVEKVEEAIALLKVRKRDRYIPNPAGYFVQALKENWVGTNSALSEETDQKTVFDYWYDLARKLGYCSGQEEREGEQWVCLSGSWERWQDAVERGYSVEYLKKVMSRNR
jgi:hypothetical protein